MNFWRGWAWPKKKVIWCWRQSGSFCECWNIQDSSPFSSYSINWAPVCCIHQVAAPISPKAWELQTLLLFDTRADTVIEMIQSITLFCQSETDEFSSAKEAKDSRAAWYRLIRASSLSCSSLVVSSSWDFVSSTVFIDACVSLISLQIMHKHTHTLLCVYVAHFPHNYSKIGCSGLGQCLKENAVALKTKLSSINFNTSKNLQRN